MQVAIAAAPAMPVMAIPVMVIVTMVVVMVTIPMVMIPVMMIPIDRRHIALVDSDRVTERRNRRGLRGA
jgi:hypothetical protein